MSDEPRYTSQSGAADPTARDTPKRIEPVRPRRVDRRAVLLALGSSGVLATAGCLTRRPQEPVGDPAPAGETPYPPDASVRFVTPTDGAVVAGYVSVVLAAENVRLEPAGRARAGAGHLHLLVDTDPVTPGEMIPDDARHFHLGEGSSETVLALDPGQHRLVCQLGDGDHRATAITDTVTVTVVGGASISIVEPADGATVTNPFVVRWATEKVRLEPAGQVRQNAGHAHLLVDTDPLPVGRLIPAGPKHLHYGGGEDEATLDLSPGEHRLVCQVGNGTHLATPLVDEVTITVAG
ncbi:DUF4399 domain-containing protein [Haloarchaeobius amylolyticus]|uniref:DUF4399 domain-containing protein n=1 Tax=Haloarchaeobius amylolyticus TaxID=1198296 RepID=UPI0022702A4C|nr:DUF4399 domain-containing protein [Haloarchaeobius amylolyticus]